MSLLCSTALSSVQPLPSPLTACLTLILLWFTWHSVIEASRKRPLHRRQHHQAVHLVNTGHPGLTVRGRGLLPCMASCAAHASHLHPELTPAHATKCMVAAGSATPAPVTPPCNRTHKSIDGGGLHCRTIRAASSANQATHTSRPHIVAARRPSKRPCLAGPLGLPIQTAQDKPAWPHMHQARSSHRPTAQAEAWARPPARYPSARAPPRRAAPHLASTESLRGRSPAAAWLILPICTPPAAGPSAIQRLFALQDRRRNSRLRPTPARTCTQAPAARAPAASRTAQHALRAASRCPQGTVRELMPARPTRAAKTRQQEL